MAEVLELRKVERPKIIIDDTIDERKIMFPEKLKEAEEMLEKYPPPASFLLSRYNKKELQDGITIQGLLNGYNTDNNSFRVLKRKGVYETKYQIHTTPDTLIQIIKVYWNKPISVQILPQINIENQFEYKLMEVKA